MQWNIENKVTITIKYSQMYQISVLNNPQEVYMALNKPVTAPLKINQLGSNRSI